MRTAPRFSLLLAAGLLAAPALADGHAGPHDGIYPQHPSLTPDASFAIFSWAGDLWSVPADGGPATRLTSHPADEMASAVSPDGSMIAFESNREGARNLYIADLSAVSGTLIASTPRRVTVSDSSHSLSGWTPEGDALLFSSFQERDIYREERMYRAPIDGGAVTRLTDAFGEHPVMSADGERVVFARGSNTTFRPVYRGTAAGEIWEFRPATGDFFRVTSDDSDDMQPHPLPDGSTLFIASGSGQYNLARKSPESFQGEQLTDFRPGAAPFEGEVSIAHGVRDLSVSADSSTAIFAVWDTLFTLDLTQDGAAPRAIEIAISGDTDAGTAAPMDLDRMASEVALSPDGKTIAIVARGEIFVRSTDDDRPARRVTESEARDQQIAWSPDGGTLYFVSDRDGSEGIYAATVALSRQDLEPQDEPMEDEPEIDEADGDDNAADEAGADEGNDDNGDENSDEDADDDDDAEEKDKGPTPGERWAESLRFAIEPVIASESVDRYPLPSPDGEELLFIRDRGDIMLYDLEDDELVTVRAGWNVPDVQWASDSEHIVFSVQDLQFNSDIWVMNIDAFEDNPDAPEAQPRNITRHPDLDVAPRLSHDGKVLYFLSDRDASQNFTYDIYRVFLDESLEDLARYELDEYFEEAGKAAKKRKPIELEEDDEAEDAGDDAEENDSDDETLEFDTDDAFLRVRRITTTAGSEGNLAATPAGDRVIFSTSIDGSRNLYSVDYRGRERKTVVSGGASNVATDLTGGKVVLVKGGQAHTVSPTGGKVTTYAIDAPIVVDRRAERAQIFNEGARIFGLSFYHPTLKGLDWDALSARYAELAATTRTNQALNRVLSALFGEVNGSHTGARGGGGFSARGPRVGFLGIDAAPTGDGYLVRRVLRDGPADNGEDGILDGDTITHINTEPLADAEIGVRDLRAAMRGTSGKETLVTVSRPTDEGPVERTLLLIPQSQGAEGTMRYRDEVERREARVLEWSGGRVGYLHIRGMSAPQVRDYERDLYAAASGREALIIDVRDNGGGWTTDILLASLTAPAHAYTVPRGADATDAEFDSYPRDRRLIHAYQRPLTVLMNQHSYSNAEIFSHSIKTTGRGTLVGTQTHGAVISTGSHSLINGSSVRIPFRGWYLPDGTDMDVYGAEPDIEIPQLPNDEAAGLDPQLKVAVDDLLGRLERGER